MADIDETASRHGLGAQLWGAVKGALIDEDPVAATRRAKLQGSRAPADPPATAAVEAPSAAMSPMAAALMAQVLSKATAYTALTEKLAPLETIVVDERTRYQAAYALIKGSRTLEQVVQAIDLHHVDALDAEVSRFAGQLKDTERREIERRNEEIKTLNASIDARHQQIAKLREQLEAQLRSAEEALQAERHRMAELTREIDVRRQEIGAVQAQFDAATQQVRESLAQAKARVLRHLG